MNLEIKIKVKNSELGNLEYYERVTLPRDLDELRTKYKDDKVWFFFLKGFLGDYKEYVKKHLKTVSKTSEVESIGQDGFIRDCYPLWNQKIQNILTELSQEDQTVELKEFLKQLKAQ